MAKNLNIDSWVLHNNKMVSAELDIQDLEEDKIAASKYFKEHVNSKYQHFGSLEEKIRYLVYDNDYWEKEFIEKYTMDEIKEVFKKAYSFNFKFQSFMSAFKFYNDYAMKTNDKQTYLERYEDRLAVNALYHSDGDVKQALFLVEQLMKQNFTPATPTLLNSGKARRGELVSCFVGDTLVREKEDFHKKIEDIQVGDCVLTNDSTYKEVTGISKRKYNEDLLEIKIVGQTKILTTPEHPFLVKTKDVTNRVQALKGKDGEIESQNIVWKHAKDLTKDDLVLVVGQEIKEDTHALNVIDYLSRDFVLVEDKIYKTTVDKKNNKKKGHNLSTQVTPIKNNIKLDRGFGELLGAFLAEGSYLNGEQNKGLRFTLNSQDSDYIEMIESRINEYFGLTSKRTINSDGSTNIDVCSIMLGQFFISLVGRGFDRKYISNEIYHHLNQEFSLGLLKGLFRGDGCSLFNGMQLDLSNPKLMKQIRDIMYSVGLNPLYREYVSQSGNTASTLRLLFIDKKELDFVKYVDKNTHKIDFHYYDNQRTPVQAKETLTIEGKNYLFNRIKSVEVKENTEEIYVYNLHVKDNHTYVVNNVVVHNCFLIAPNDSLTDIYKNVEFASQLLNWEQ